MSYRRTRSIDLAHFSPTLSRSQTRIRPSLARRSSVSTKPPKPHNFTRYTRHAAHLLKAQQTEYRIRNSVADLVMKELDDFDRCIFYQRVFILAKNVTLTVSAQSSVASILSKYMNSKTSENVDARTDGEVDGETQPDEEGDFSEVEMDEISQAQQKNDMENVNTNTELQNKKDPLLLITQADLEAGKTKEKRMQELDFFDKFKEKVEYFVRKCDLEQLSEDRFSGLFLCMGNSHSLFVLEGTEDTIALFSRELMNVSNEYFETLRVFLVEDRIEETYFDEFNYRRSVAMNINEKFPPPTANDPQLMGSQHWLIKEKLRILCQTLSYEIRPKPESVHIEIAQQPVFMIVEDKKKPDKKKRKPKRKKRTKSPITAITGLDPGTSKTSNILQLQDSATEGVAHISDAAEMHEIDDIQLPPPSEPVQKIEDEISIATTVLGPITETVKNDENSDNKEPSNVRVLALPKVMGEEQDVPEEIEEEDYIPKEILKPFAVKPSIYNRLLPEIQRIDLVLTSKRFYLDLAQFVPFSQEIPMQPDEDTLIWPTSYNYLPLNVFERQPYDVNLTFGNYDVKETEEEETDSSEDDEKDEKGDKKEE